MLKEDVKHKWFTGRVFTSAGIGRGYVFDKKRHAHKFRGKEKVLTLASKTTYYPIFASETTLTGNVTFRNDIGTIYLTATCAYL